MDTTDVISFGVTEIFMLLFCMANSNWNVGYCVGLYDF